MRRVIASWFGTGLILRHVRGSDAGSGTLAAAVTLVLVFATRGWVVDLVVAITVTALALWSSAPFAADDPGWVVVDEAAGLCWATIGLGGWAVVVAFVVFRVTDITKKPPGIAASERLHGAVGVTLDDVVAGLYALAVGWLFMLAIR
jgi:phosphatidylglycerophosphatase A